MNIKSQLCAANKKDAFHTQVYVDYFYDSEFLFVVWIHVVFLRFSSHFG
jgi:hypothetical protein